MASVPSNDPSFADIVTVQMLESIRTTRTLGNFDDTRNYCWVKDMTAEALMHQWLNKLDNEKRCKIGKLPVMHHWPVDASAGGRGIGNDRHVNRHDASASTERVEAVGQCVDGAVLMHHLAGRRAVDGQGWAEYVNASLAHHLAMWRAAGERAARRGADGQGWAKYANASLAHHLAERRAAGERAVLMHHLVGGERRMGKGGQNMLMHHWRIIWGRAGGGGACGRRGSMWVCQYVNASLAYYLAVWWAAGERAASGGWD
ncbi:hypothetical protein L210DRAFT_3629414 [Boletus edulis BED1]|uniref:Uncharacterized protein n=1 Tax=Boletus edulis BED1 TaxID=1328754 RepID=A0AAD4BZ82_BOLED|nr:hypothetical protein L210DRAFT_3629414 [Boletus edulis BED1]